MQFPKWPYYSEDEIEDVGEVLRSGRVNYWTGENCRQLEQAFGAYLAVDYSIVLANGTLALDNALYALSIEAGDEVIIPCRTFIASASCIALRGGVPVLADVDLASQNISLKHIEKVVTKKTKGIIVVHLGGMPCDMDPILDFAKKHKLWIIEDCAQSLGAQYKGSYVGTLGDIGTFSFCQDKIISTGGEGGLVVTNDKLLYDKMWSYKDHGKNYELMRNISYNSFDYQWVYDTFGSNYRMTEMQAVIGRSQLKKLPSWLKQRRLNASVYNEYIDNIPQLHRTTFNQDYKHSYYKYYIFAQSYDIQRYLLMHLNKIGIQANLGICPDLSKENVFKKCMEYNRFFNAEVLGQTAIALPVYPTLNEEHIHFIGMQLAQLMKDVK